MDETPTITSVDHTELTRIIHSNHRIRQIVQQATNEFLSLKNDLLQQIQKEKFDETIEHKSKPLIDVLEIQSLNKQVTSDKLQLALVGENSCGKTSLIHHLLDAEPFLPSDVGSVSARIIRLTYAENIYACLRVYPSLNDQHKEPDVHISLSGYFSGSEPDWNGVKDAIKEHVERPDPEKMKKTSNEFAEWAKFFVEIRIPSNFLKLGIDLYDTPGLLYSDPEILKTNLHNLVKTIIPTVVFMYENASVVVDTKDCFLALKEALGKQLDDTSIFFLNTKVDIGTILTEDIEINIEEFENKILSNVRQKSKDLLLKAPSMATELSEGGEFDIISIESQWSPYGVKMNQLTVNHLIQFVASSDLKAAKKVSKLVLPIINSFFDFAFVTNHRTNEQLQELYRNAHQWAENYFIGHQTTLDDILRKLYDAIIKEIGDKMDSIVGRAAKQDTVEIMEKYIRSLIQHEIIQDIVKKFTGMYAAVSMLRTLLDPSLLNNADKNELLVAAQQNLLIRSLNIDDETSCQLYLCGTIITPLRLITDILIESDDEDNQTNPKKNLQWNKLKKQLRQSVIKKSIRSKNTEKSDIARQYLNDIRSGFMDQKNYINEVLRQWCEQEKVELKEKFDQQYKLAEKFLPQRGKAYDLANKYAGQFARIECKLIIAQSLASFNGHIPTLNSIAEPFIDENKFFKIYLAEWFDKKDLIVKKLETTLDLQYLEAHYYQKLSKLGVSNYLPLLYLYQNDDNELLMFFPKYEYLENNLNTITIKNALKIILAVAKCLERLHANELIHGDVNIKNIYITNDEQYLFGDFHSKGTYETLEDYVNRHKMNKSVWAYTNDIYSLGELGMFLCESLEASDESAELLDKFKILLKNCLDKDSISRPKASQIVEKLSSLIEKA
jgi:tRNA A-37 threonylcarbamoyl transferase component Bud32